MFRPRNGTHYWHRTEAGVLAIGLTPKGWRYALDGEPFDVPRLTALQALDDLLGGHCEWPGGVDPSTLGVPDDLNSWTSER